MQDLFAAGCILVPCIVLVFALRILEGLLRQCGSEGGDGVRRRIVLLGGGIFLFLCRRGFEIGALLHGLTPQGVGMLCFFLDDILELTDVFFCSQLFVFR